MGINTKKHARKIRKMAAVTIEPRIQSTYRINGGKAISVKLTNGTGADIPAEVIADIVAELNKRHAPRSA